MSETRQTAEGTGGGRQIRAVPPAWKSETRRGVPSLRCVRALPKPCMPGWVRSRLTVNTASRQPFMSRPWVSSHLREKSSRGNPTPRFPMPPQSYVIRKKQHEESSDREVVVRYEALRLQLSQLSALGLLTDEGWKNEPSHAHLWLSWRHLSRALFLLARCGARCLRTTIRGCLPRTEPKRTASHPSSPSRRSPLPQNKFDKLGGRIDADASDTPDVDELWATKGIVLPVGTFKEKCAHTRARCSFVFSSAKSLLFRGPHDPRAHHIFGNHSAIARVLRCVGHRVHVAAGGLNVDRAPPRYLSHIYHRHLRLARWQVDDRQEGDFAQIPQRLVSALRLVSSQRYREPAASVSQVLGGRALVHTS